VFSFRSKTQCRLTLRAAVVPVLLFYGLASARALVPGLCATQSALDEHQAESAATCCSLDAKPSDANGEPAVAQHSEHAECAFCSLSKGFVQPLVRCIYEQRMMTLLRFHAVELAPAHLPDVWDPASPRDPPAES
jgi:hypothetical protein